MPINLEMNEDMFVVVMWPDVQEYQDLDGFDDNSVLINDGPLLGEYGGSAYMVRCNWLMDITIDDIIGDIEKVRDSDNHVCPADEDDTKECSCNEYDHIIDKLNMLKISRKPWIQ